MSSAGVSSARMGIGSDCRKALLGALPRPLTTKVLPDIQGKAPGEVRLTSLAADKSSALTIQGEALSVGSVHRFVALLADSASIERADLSYVRAGGADEDGLSTYKIDCRLHDIGYENE